MGKNKEHKIELINAFSRMNYLYQASVTASKTVPDTILGNYYGRLMREVSKKVVEKIHPAIKRTLCSSCSYPSFIGTDYGSSKIKPYKKTKSRKKKIIMTGNNVKEHKEIRNKTITKNYSIAQKSKKILKPNKLLWNCKKCGFSRTFLQRPTHQLWIDKCDDNDVNNV